MVVGALALSAALALASQATAQTLMCASPAPVPGLPEGGVVVLVLGPSGAQLHGCMDKGCQPVTDGLVPSAITEEEIGLADPVMDIEIHIMRNRRPLEMRLDTRQGDEKRSVALQCAVQ
jgi:hypothetical protein